LGHYLRELGAGPEARVAICLERSLEMVIAVLGTLKAGAAYVPMDPQYPEDRLQYMVQDSRPIAVITHSHVEAMFTRWKEVPPLVDLSAPSWAGDATEEINPGDVGVTPNHPAYVIYTSGSTGKPKGVIGLHRGILNRCSWMWNQYPFRKGEICCQKTSPSFVDSIAELLLPLVCRVPLVLIPEKAASDPNELVKHLAAAKASRIVLVPSLLQSILQIESIAELLPNLKLWVVSGEPLTREIYKSFREVMGPVCLLNLYGSSEVSADATYMETSHTEEGESIPIGRPIANTYAYVLDGDGQPAPIGITGELYISGAPLARSYLHRPDLTAERFVPNPHSTEPGGRMYKTGDLCKWRDDGTLEFVSRNDDQVKIRGYRIELGEIAARLEEHEKIKEAMVVVREDTPGDKRLVAYYTCRNVGPNQDEANIEAKQLRDYVRAILPKYMVPAAYVRLEHLPLTPNGKLDRRHLPKPGAHAYGTLTYEEPIGETETLLAQIWAEVLKLEKVGRHDNFFQLGGHSLLAVTLIQKMKRNGFEGNVRTLFVTPTIAQLAETEMQEVRL